MITAAIIAGAIFSILPLTLIIVIILLIMVFFRLGKIKKELRIRNEEDGIFLSKRRKRKHEEKNRNIDVKKEGPQAPEDKGNKKIEVEEEED